MNIELVIAIVVIIAIGTCFYTYSRSKKLQQTLNDSKDAILRDFLQIFIVIAKDCIEVLSINNLNISKDEYKGLLAKKIVEVFDRDIHYDKIIFTDEEKISFVKQYVLSADMVVEKLENYFSPKDISDKKEIRDAGATEVISDKEANDIINDSTKTSMVGTINNFYEDTK